MSKKYIVLGKKGASFRLKNIEDGFEYRLFQRDCDVKLVAGSLIEANTEISGNLISRIDVISEVVGDSTKPRVEVDASTVQIGDLIDGIPVVSLGKVYAKDGKKMAYAYFKSFDI